MNISPSYKPGGCPHGTFNDTHTAAVSLYKQKWSCIYVKDGKTFAIIIQSTEAVSTLGEDLFEDRVDQ
jgi:hypothetical protein